MPFEDLFDFGGSTDSSGYVAPSSQDEGDDGDQLPEEAQPTGGKVANPELAQAIYATAKRIGIDPVDLATAISYETGGTFDPWKRGPTTQWGTHRGLIQWGERHSAKWGWFGLLGG